MEFNKDQQVRIWIDTTLRTTKDGIAPHILAAFKNYYSPTNYMGVIRGYLSQYNTNLDPQIFVNEAALIAGTAITDWLHLMSRSWDNLFQKRFGKVGKEHLELLRQARNKWAHPTDIIAPAEALWAARAALYFLGHFQAKKFVEEVQAIVKELEAIENDVQPEQSDSLPPPPAHGPEKAELPHVEDFDGHTERLTPPAADSGLSIEIVKPDTQTAHQLVPSQMSRILIGRGYHSHICVDDQRVSRAHLLLVRNASGLLLTDLFSANGTKLEGRLVQPNTAVHWSVGQVVEIGNTWLILRRGAESNTSSNGV
jgi:hypothetical protein